MSKLADQLRKMRIFNTHDVLAHFGQRGRDVCVSYSPHDARRCMASASKVYSPSHQTNPAAAWYDYGCKSFVGDRAASLVKALEWASKVYGIKEWATCPFDRSAKIPAEVLAAAKKAVKQPKSL